MSRRHRSRKQCKRRFALLYARGPQAKVSRPKVGVDDSALGALNRVSNTSARRAMHIVACRRVWPAIIAMAIKMRPIDRGVEGSIYRASSRMQLCRIATADGDAAISPAAHIGALRRRKPADATSCPGALTRPFTQRRNVAMAYIGISAASWQHRNIFAGTYQSAEIAGRNHVFTSTSRAAARMEAEAVSIDDAATSIAKAPRLVG